MSSQFNLPVPPEPTLDGATLSECAEACFDCADVCLSSADASISQYKFEAPQHCIRAALDCADLCTVTGRMLLRQGKLELAALVAQVQACRTLCEVCVSACERLRSRYAHCGDNADGCRACDRACRDLLMRM